MSLKVDELMGLMVKDALEDARSTGLILTKISRNFIRGGVVPGSTTCIFNLAIDFYDFCESRGIPKEKIVEYSAEIDPFAGEVDKLKEALIAGGIK